MGQRRTLAAIAGIAIVVGFLQLAIGPGQSGITVDEPIQLGRTAAWLDGGDYVPPRFSHRGGAISSPWVYGPAFSATAHSINAIAGQEPWNSVSFEEGAAVDRHLVSALFALLTALAAGLAIAVATGSRTIGFWTAAALLAIPIWVGMGFFNPKDTPVAAGYTFFTAALIIGLRTGDGGRRPDRWDAITFVLAAGGVMLAAGTRLAMWLPLVLSLAIFLGLVLFSRARGGDPNRWPVPLAGIVTGVVGLVLLYPAVFTHPLDLVTGTLHDSSNYPWTGFTLTAGKLLSENPPWWYLPAWAFASIPVLLGLAALAGLAGALAAAWRRAREHGFFSHPPGLRESAVLLALAQVLILPIASVAAQSTLYTGLRQHLYVVPAVAMLAGVGASFLTERAAGWRRTAGLAGPWASWAVTAVLALALLIPTIEQVRLFPYNYVYVNPIAGIGGVNDRWEGDYWLVSLRAASNLIPDGELAWCGTAYGGRPTKLDLELCSNRFRPYALQDQTPPPVQPGQRWTILRRRAGATLPAACVPAGEVTRKLRGETLVLSYVARC